MDLLVATVSFMATMNLRYVFPNPGIYLIDPISIESQQFPTFGQLLI
ncbi:MAG: hypothetical protein VX776_03100 [Planctomycetota bacterium]|nr:hypothetical protein [Planctomycetota bacterium]